MGRYGVQLFFFVSALTMCYMWGKRSGERSPIAKFYIRRFLRIAPLFWLAIPTYLYLQDHPINASEIAMTAIFLHGFRPDIINSIVPGGWSIAVEMSFYCIFPLLIIKFKENANKYLYASIFVYFLYEILAKGAIISAASGSYSAVVMKEFLFFNFLNQAPVFLLGCYLYFSIGTNNLKENWKIHAGWLITAFAAKQLLHTEPEGTPSDFLFLLVYSAIGLTAYVALSKKWSSGVLEMIGKRSYAIYLSHFIVLAALSKVLQAGLWMSLLAFTITVLASHAIAFMSDNLVERHVHRLATRLTR